jgi:general secretion pathway protein D
MSRSRLHRILLSRVLAGCLALAAASPALAQDDGEDAPLREEDQIVQLNPREGGWEIQDLFRAISEMTGASILFEGQNAVIKSKKIEFIGTQPIPKARLFDWLQAVLSYHGLVLVPVGPESPTGQQQWFALDQANANLTSRPVYIAEGDILDYADRDGLYVVTSITLKNIKDTGRVRQALSQMSTKTAGLGRINDIQGSRSLIIGDFAPIVAAMKRLVDFIDIESGATEPFMKVIHLQHAVATELEPILQELIEQSTITQQRPGRQPANQLDEPEPKIMADPRLDALIVYAVETHMNKIEELISQLDVPNTNYRQRIHFRPLKHTDADEMAGILQELITDAGVAGGSRTSSGRRNARPANQQTQPGAFGGGVAEGEPVIIADRRSNSLIVHASPTQFTEIDELITQLDRSRPQVLIETALVELALTDQLTLGVELFGSSNNILVDTDGDGVGDTLTEDTKFFGSSLFGFSEAVTREVDGVSVPVGRSPTLGTGFTAGIFKDGKMPVLLSAFASSGRAKIATMPSVVTNDNEEATLRLERTTSFRQSIRDDTGDTRDSFDSVTATTELRISPTIASDNYLRLTIDQQVANFGARPQPDAPPDQVSRTVSTNVTVPDKYTVVLGGLVQKEERSSVSKVPFLGDLPLVGWLFRTSDDSANPSHLFLFVTPRILRDTETFTDYHRLTWEKKLLQDDIFGSEVDLLSANFRGPNAEETAEERLRRIEESGELDGPRLKAPPSEEERIEMARRKLDAGEATPPPAPQAPQDGGGTDGN